MNKFDPMDAAEAEENLFAAGDAKLHGYMCKQLAAFVRRILEIFPVLEAGRPTSKSGIQALCSLHVALDKAKNLLQHCSECSKLYLAITGESILMKFEKAKSALQESLKRVEEIVPQSIGCQIMKMVNELEGTILTLDEAEKEAGDDVIALLQKERKYSSNSNDCVELEIFHRAAMKLGITSARAALTERRALKKLIERARAEEDKRKESIVAFLLHLMRKYSKLFRTDATDDTDSQASVPCSPTVSGEVNGRGFERQLSKLCSFNFKQNGTNLCNIPMLPEEFRCSISLQIMYDPVIISSGQTYERVCIEKWFKDGHITCPKTQQKLSHLDLTPNYCVKGLIATWCNHKGIPVPNGPPESLDLNYWRLAMAEREASLTDSRSIGSVNSCQLKEVKVVPLEENGVTFEEKSTSDELKGDVMDIIDIGSMISCQLKEVKVVPLEENGVTLEEKSTSDDLNGDGMDIVDNMSCEQADADEYEGYESLLAVLSEGQCWRKQCKAVERIRFMLKDDEEARIYMGANGFVEALVQFLRSAVDEGDEIAQEIGAMALFNLAVNSNRNKSMLLSCGVVPVIEKMIVNPSTCEPATALCLNLSCSGDAKPVLASSPALPHLVCLLHSSSPQSTSCKHDALHALFNLSTYPPNTPSLVAAGAIAALHSLLTALTWTEKALAVLMNLVSHPDARRKVVATPGFISSLAAVLDSGEPAEQEQSAACLLVLCEGDEKCSQVVLEEGVIPALVSVSVNGSPRGKEKSQKLLKLFREQRQREQMQQQQLQQQMMQLQQETLQQCRVESGGGTAAAARESRIMMLKSRSRRLGNTISLLWKSRRNFSVH